MRELFLVLVLVAAIGVVFLQFHPDQFNVITNWLVASIE
jgi:hypothetical protein